MLINGRPMWVSRNGQTHWNPDVVADHGAVIGLHEAAHCVASYWLGRETHSAQAGSHKGLTLMEPTNDVFSAVVCLLAGEAFERSIGLPPSGTMKDVKKATQLLEREGLSGQDLDEACRVTEEAAIELTRSERFQTLVFALGPVIAKERYVGERQILRILEANDPERPKRPLTAAHAHVETHSRMHMAPVSRILHDDGTVTLYSNGRLLLSRGSRSEADRLAAEILDGGR